MPPTVQSESGSNTQNLWVELAQNTPKLPDRGGLTEVKVPHVVVKGL